MNESLLVAAESMQNMMLSISQSGKVVQNDFSQARQALIGIRDIDALVPRFVKTCRTPMEFWGYIKALAGYEARRNHIWDGFRPLLEHLENPNRAPADKLVSAVLQRFDADHVAAAWQKALERRTVDPEGAITSARTLLESVCKHILDEESTTYNDKDDLPKLYRLTAEKLNIAPSQHTEEVFRQILGGCTAVVEGLGTLRNRLSDAHGKGKIAARPAPRHAELAVNLSGALAMFVLSTWEERKKLT